MAFGRMSLVRRDDRQEELERQKVFRFEISRHARILEACLLGGPWNGAGGRFCEEVYEVILEQSHKDWQDWDGQKPARFLTSVND